MNESQGVSKPLVGILALALLATAGGLYALAPDKWGLMSACWRIGVLMSAFWLALPPKGKKFAWERGLPVIIGAVAVIAAGRRALVVLPLVILVALAYAFLRPRPKRGPQVPGRRTV